MVRVGKLEWEFDFLEINKEHKSKLGNYSYEITDTKNSSKIKGDHIYQLGIYLDLLKDAQGTLPIKFYILLKDKVKKTVKLMRSMILLWFIKNHTKSFYLKK